jgi:hypothetical protein
LLACHLPISLWRASPSSFPDAPALARALLLAAQSFAAESNLALHLLRTASVLPDGSLVFFPAGGSSLRCSFCCKALRGKRALRNHLQNAHLVSVTDSVAAVQAAEALRCSSPDSPLAAVCSEPLSPFLAAARDGDDAALLEGQRVYYMC